MLTFYPSCNRLLYFAGSGIPEPTRATGSESIPRSRRKRTKTQSNRNAYHRTYILQGGNEEERGRIAQYVIRHIMKNESSPQTFKLERSKSRNRLAIISGQENADMSRCTFEAAEERLPKEPFVLMQRFLNTDLEFFKKTMAGIIDLGKKTSNALARAMYDAYYKNIESGKVKV